MGEMVRHNCGLAVAHSLHDAYALIRSLQHRGREAAGIAAIGHEKIDVLKWVGNVTAFDLGDLHKIFPGSEYHTFMTHVRYATKGRKDKILEDAHPHVIGGTQDYREDHIIVRNCEVAGAHNGHGQNEVLQSIDRSLLRTDCDTEQLLHYYKQHGEKEILRQISGAYVMAIADKRRKEVMVLRDRTGIKPGVLGWKDGKYGVASEDIAFRKNGGFLVEDLDPGAVYYLDAAGHYEKEQIVEPKLAFCRFEYEYLGDLDSIMNGINVRRIRDLAGEQLAEEISVGADIDLVTYVPRCPEIASWSLARKLGVSCEPIFYKKRGERSFQGSTAGDRRKSIDQNLHLLPGLEEYLSGKKVLVVDDSAVRGNVRERIKYLLYEKAQVASARLVVYTPPIGVMGRGCMFGVDMPPDDDFLVRRQSVEELANAEQLPTHFMSVEGSKKVFEKAGIPACNLCNYCIGGRHPFEE